MQLYIALVLPTQAICLHNPKGETGQEDAKRLIAALIACSAVASPVMADTLKKIKDTGSVTMGVRESSGRCPTPWRPQSSATTSRSATADVLKARLNSRPQGTSAGDLAEPHPAGAERHRRHRVRLDHQQRHAPEGRRLRRHHLRRRSAHRRQGQLGHHEPSPAQRQDVATTTGTTRADRCASTSAPEVDFKEVFGKDHADSFLLLESGRADAFVMDGQILAGNIAKAKNPADLQDRRRGAVASSRSPSCCARTTRPSRRRSTTASRP